jgi:RNA polymerase sigma-70 factor (ECF subfamily)
VPSARPTPANDEDGPGPRRGVVRALPFVGGDAQLVEALRDGHPSARAELFDRHSLHVQRVLARVLGNDPELPDLLHDVFLRAFAGIGGLRDPAAIRGWLTSIAVFTARGCIRRRSLRRALGLASAREPAPDPVAPVAGEDAAAAARATYAVLGRMPADERVAFALRYVDGMELTEVAQAAGCSLATIKRRLARARQRFLTLGHREPALANWMGGARWLESPT